MKFIKLNVTMHVNIENIGMHICQAPELHLITYRLSFDHVFSHL